MDTPPPFWLDDFKILYVNKNYISFFPSENMTKNEQLNSITRFGIYLFILLLIFSDNNNWLFFPILIIVISIFLRKTDNFETFYKKNESKQQASISFQEPTPTPNKIKKKGKKLKCTPPTLNNPFMNILPTTNPKRSKACDPLDQEIKKEITTEFNKDLIQKPINLFENQTAMLPFYTTAVTEIPNNQTAFAEWLYGNNENCKTDTQYCLKNSDVKYNKSKW
ncbi:hypothetical protein CPAV1605_662 [seawater metagenome]|uniref:Minor capsid protein P9 transmembrane helices domain-containing protein n=1 Tax=seawater metagenome TaxID=1561972 RepID=A0A5E8CIN2_9ZZZZ